MPRSRRTDDAYYYSPLPEAFVFKNSFRKLSDSILIKFREGGSARDRVPASFNPPLRTITFTKYLIYRPAQLHTSFSGALIFAPSAAGAVASAAAPATLLSTALFNTSLGSR
ncbi:hypothetical protein GWI33_003204 [Rhynchophorus ferrugineus]|uniref:Uncharacterized protein n=1 Tax=Rhynchophorus ferrugineus TaxID=354439 RepID=A0A834IV07_RHYFE|nr:hypothetical protein GWI33_003204 [Rhynchophorus ferrugineus]